MFSTTKPITPLFFFFIFFFLFVLLAFSTTGWSASVSPPSKTQIHNQGFNEGKLLRWRSKEPRRLMIGSTAPTCTYNECRGCRYRCKAEQIPVDANDPINSAYHYKCVCYR